MLHEKIGNFYFFFTKQSKVTDENYICPEYD